MTPSKTLRRILDNDLCTGCGLCASALGKEAIRMQMQGSGFLRPVQTHELTPQNEKRFAAICPGIQLDLKNSEAHHHPLWGPIVKVRIGAATDPNLRHRASSGGALSAIATYLLARKDVLTIVHTGPAVSSPIDNEILESVDASGVLRGAGSRYAPSAPLTRLEQQLSTGQKFALIGKPCDIAGARNLARYDQRVDLFVPYMLSFFCAGIPSRRGTQKIIRTMQLEEKEVVSFRYRGDGWPGYATAITRGGKVAQMSYTDSWGGILSKHTQFRCKICPDGTGGFADVAFADAWDCDEQGYPLFEEQDGRSLIVTRTHRGELLVQTAIKDGFLTAKEIDSDRIEAMQPGQARRKRLVLSRLLAMRLFGYIPRFSGLHLKQAAADTSVAETLRSFAGMMRRLLVKAKV